MSSSSIKFRSFLLQSLDDIVLKRQRRLLRTIPLDRHSVPADQKLAKVPLDTVHAQSAFPIRVILQKQKQFRSVFPVDVSFIAKVADKLRVPLLLQVVEQVLPAEGLLPAELVAGLGYDLQPAGVVLVVKSVELLVIVPGQASLAGHVGH